MNQIELLKVLRNKKIIGKLPSHQTVVNLVNDHRLVEADSCFVAIQGENFNGHDVVKEVVEAGASIVVLETLPKNIELDRATYVLVDSTIRSQAILANQFFNQPSQRLNLVAVTGTNGKTTTTTMISELLEILGHKTGLIGTLHYKVDQTYQPAINTTPESLKMQSLFKQMLEHDCQDAIIEASSHALALGRVWYTDVDCAIFTNLSREHLDFHKSIENYAYSKSLLFAQLGQSFSKGKAKLAIVNIDDEYAETMIQASSADLATYSLENPSATAYGHSIEVMEQGLRFQLDFQAETYSLELPMLGTYNVANYLAAFLCLSLYYGYQPEEILQATKSFSGVRGRMQVIDEGQDFRVIVDFAHTPDALENVLYNLSKSKQGRLIVMMGHSGGNRDSGMRPELGDILFKYGDFVVLTADNPRHEDVTKICLEILGNHDKKEYKIILDRQEAIEYIIDHAQRDDTIVFAGKGGEPYQVIGDEYVPFDEIEFVTNYIAKKRGV